MYISFSLIAMAGLLSHTISPWEFDYRAARQVGDKQHKPLAVFVGAGPVNWSQLTREGKSDAEVQKALSQKYVRVYVDSNTDYGRKIADLFGLKEKRGLFISDRTGQYQAFRHDGTLPAQELVRFLNRFADPDHVVVTTETNQPVPVAAPITVNYENPYPQQCLT